MPWNAFRGRRLSIGVWPYGFHVTNCGWCLWHQFPWEHFTSYHNAVGSTGNLHQKIMFYNRSKSGPSLSDMVPQNFMMFLCGYHFYHSKPSTIAFLVHPKWVYGGFLSHGGTPRSFQIRPFEKLIPMVTWEIPKMGSPQNHPKLIVWLVVSTPLKNMKVSWDELFPIYGKLLYFV